MSRSGAQDSPRPRGLQYGLPLAPYMTFIDEGRRMPRRARVAALAIMSVSVSISLAWQHAGGRLSLVLALLIGGAAGVGTLAVLMYHRRRWRIEGPA